MACERFACKADAALDCSLLSSARNLLQRRLQSLSLSASAWLILNTWTSWTLTNTETSYRHLNKEKQGIKYLIFHAVSIAWASIIRPSWPINPRFACLQLDGRILQTLLFTGGWQYPVNIFGCGYTTEMQLNHAPDKWYNIISNLMRT